MRNPIQLKANHVTEKYPKICCDGGGSLAQLSMQPANTAAGAGGQAGTQHWEGRKVRLDVHLHSG